MDRRLTRLVPGLAPGPAPAGRPAWRSALAPLAAAAALALLLPAAASAAGDPAKGKETYQMFCVTCHGPEGKGNGPAAPKDPAPRDFTQASFKYDANGDGTAGDAEDLKLIIKNGAAQYGGSPMMAPWGHLSEAQIQNLVAYVQSLEE